MNRRTSPLRRRRLWLAIASLAVASPAMAGPPYVTDDPEPTETGHWEDYAFVTETHVPGETQGEAGLQFNYGGAKDLQLSANLPLDYDHRSGYRFGAGDINLSAKYRFLHQSDHSWSPDVAVFPALNVPTAGRTFGSGHVSLFLPVWLQKDFGKWSVFGGGGYDINPGDRNRSFTLVGGALTRSVTERLNLGVELYHQTPAVVGEHAQTNLGVGVIYQLTKHIALMASGGPGLESPRDAGQSAVYVSLQLTY